VIGHGSLGRFKPDTVMRRAIVAQAGYSHLNALWVLGAVGGELTIGGLTLYGSDAHICQHLQKDLYKYISSHPKPEVTTSEPPGRQAPRKPNLDEQIDPRREVNNQQRARKSTLRR
jgi:hypothetical protein